MWIWTKPASLSNQRGASEMPSGSIPLARIASPSATPASSRRCNTLGTSSFPARALLPKVGVLKRAPSSSANERTAIGAAEGAAISNPQATPSGPSNRPPPRTLSRCEHPTAHHGGGSSGQAHRLPAGSRSTASPISAA